MERKTVIITGGNTGIGKATAMAFAKKGYNVIISGRNEETANETLLVLKEAGAKVLFVKTDVRMEQEVIQLIEKSVREFGQLDVIVNNAGIAGEENGLLAGCTAENVKA